MTNPDDLERAVERLSEMLPRLDACSGYAAHSGTPAARQTGKPRDLYWNDHLASDLRRVLSANREMGELLTKVEEHLRPRSGRSRHAELHAAIRSALTTQRGDGE